MRERERTDAKRKQIEAGVLVFDSSDVGAAMKTYFGNLDKLLDDHPMPKALCTDPMVINMPHGRSFFVTFCWSGPATPESKAWQERLAALGPCVMQDVKTTTPLAHLEALTAMISPKVYGSFETVSLAHYHPSAVAALADVAVTMPNEPMSGLAIHSFEACSPSCQPREDGSFLARRQHYLVEIAGLAATPEAAPEMLRWAADAREKLAATEGVMEETYFAMTAPDVLNLEKAFGKHLHELRDLKKELDPNGVFKHGFPRL
jgi:hypothetical protein